MSENSVNKIFFSEETQEKESKDSKKKSKMLSTSSTQDTGAGSTGESRKIKTTPLDATGLVRITESGKLKVDTKAVALENKKLKANEGVLQDELVALRAQLEMYKSPGSHPVTSPANNLPISEGLEGALSKNQFDQ